MPSLHVTDFFILILSLLQVPQGVYPLGCCRRAAWQMGCARCLPCLPTGFCLKTNKYNSQGKINKNFKAAIEECGNKCKTFLNTWMK